MLFAALIRPFGLIVATYSAFMFSILGSKEMRWVESVIAGAAMTAFCVLLFVYLLNLPFQLWPQANAADDPAQSVPRPLQRHSERCFRRPSVVDGVVAAATLTHLS